jgi:hypothetical protein
MLEAVISSLSRVTFVSSLLNLCGRFPLPPPPPPPPSPKGEERKNQGGFRDRAPPSVKNIISELSLFVVAAAAVVAVEEEQGLVVPLDFGGDWCYGPATTVVVAVAAAVVGHNWIALSRLPLSYNET